MSKTPVSPRSKEVPPFYLPDFCAARAVFAVVLISELVALVLTLAREELRFGFWLDLGRTSLFLLWIAMCSAAVLCVARSWLARLDTRTASATSLALLVGVTIVISEAAFWLGQYWLKTAHSAGQLFPPNHAAFLLRNTFIAFIVSALALRYFFVAYQWRRNVELKAHARLEALQSRIQPHFLFNSMNTIAALTRSQPQLAEEAVENLADLFRANLKEARNLIALSEELQVARLYQRMEELRLGPRLQVQWNLGALPEHVLVPSLMIQPLLENAIFHGVERVPEGGTVTIEGRLADGNIELVISNPILAEGIDGRRGGNRLAMENIRERLELAYPGRARLEVRESSGRFEVKLTVPV